MARSERYTVSVESVSERTILSLIEELLCEMMQDDYENTAGS